MHQTRFQFEPGDIVAFWGRGLASWTIRVATNGPSHIGIILPYHHERYGKTVALFESTTLCPRPCLEFDQVRDGVQVNDPWGRLDDYDGRAVVYRMRPFWGLSGEELVNLGALVHNCFVAARDGYDMARALLSGTRILKLFVKEWLAPDPGAFFCSELCAAALQRANRLNHKNPYLYTPASLVRELVAQGKVSPIYVRDDFEPSGAGFVADWHARGNPWLTA